ncbi:FAD-dependent oxidoreductase [Phycisphaerales bacterium AB-hyl4]|uniref:FAD-dependent oxidoreductase n=1 Tax=Natronomicrosphaera hydrolytica TaxID=3242702 RepID=A0ABV4UAI4_9BACT
MSRQQETSYDLAVIGAGSGGYAAALAAARLGRSVLLVEKSDTLGGNAVRCGVNVWEPGAGGTGIPFDLYTRIKRDEPGAIGVYSFGRHMLDHDPEQGGRPFPGGEQVIDPARCYRDTLQRHGTKGLKHDMARCRSLWHGVPFEPWTMHRAMAALLAETGRCEVRFNVGFDRVAMRDAAIEHVVLSDATAVRAHSYVDGTADGWLCLAAGCAAREGEDTRADFGEPDAPEQPTGNINGVTLVYRITPAADEAVEPLPAETPAACWWRERFPVASFTQYPNGDYNVNMLPTMEGHAFRQMLYADVYAECTRRVRAHWHDLQQHVPEFRRYRMSWIAPGLGVRESRRIICDYMLTEHDLLAGLAGQRHADIIAIADHAMDTHGRHIARGCAELDAPYGVPLRCLLPRGVTNLMIACRAAGFSALAASSCRLSRTMMQLGQAAGTAAALACEADCSLRDVPAERLRASLRKQHVMLDWRMPTLHLAGERYPVGKC